MSTRLLLGLGVVALAIALLLHLPVALIYASLQPEDGPPPAVALHGIEGSLSAGRIDGVTSQGRTLLTDLRWQFRPLSLLKLRAGFQLNAIDGPILLDGHASVSPLGVTRLRDFRVNASLRALLAGAGYPFVPVDGQAGLNLSQLQVHEGRLQRAEGQVEVRGLAWALGSVPTALGDFRADITTEDDQIVAKLSPLSGVLDVSGEARLHPDQRYQVQLRLKPRPNAPPMVANLLRQLGAPDAQGYHRLQREGQLRAAEPKG